MIKHTITLKGIALTLALSASAAVAKNEHHKEHKKKTHQAEKIIKKQHKKAESTKFTSDEQLLIQDYYYRHRYDSGRTTIPKGIQKKYKRTGELPPGWQKKLQQGQVLPLDIYDRANPLPCELKNGLPLGPIGSQIIEIEGKVIRLMEGTRMILDVFQIKR